MAFSTSCVSGSGAASVEYPVGFQEFSDSAKIQFITNNFSPEETAEMICEAALDKNQDFSLNRFDEAVRIALYSYDENSRIIFARTLNNYPRVLNPEDRLKLYYIAGRNYPERLGKLLAYDFVNDSVSSINDEINFTKKIISELSGNDSAFFKKFSRGIDEGLTLPG